MTKRFWLADIDREADPPYIWQPCLETGTGIVLCFEIWFETKQECEEWIRQHVIGAPLEAT